MGSVGSFQVCMYHTGSLRFYKENERKRQNRASQTLRGATITFGGNFMFMNDWKFIGLAGRWFYRGSHRFSEECSI